MVVWLVSAKPVHHRVTSVFRVETPEHIGPYHSLEIIHKLGLRDLMSNVRPVAWYDDCTKMNSWLVGLDWRGAEIHQSYFFGFHSLDQAVDWFGPVAPKLKKNGYVVSCYRVPVRSVSKCKHQAVFDHTEAELVAVYDPTEVLRKSEKSVKTP